MTRLWTIGLAGLALAAQTPAPANPAAWQDPSPHEIRFVTVEPGVQLEVLDWAGQDTPIVLLAGSGNSAHVYDEFAPQLTRCCHPYAITRRGFGASSQPAGGYDDQRLADDVLHVLDALKIKYPVLVGHSMAGGELTTIGRQHSDRLSGLVYLDALGDPRDWPAADPAYIEAMRKLPEPPKPACSENRTSFAALQASLKCAMGVELPEAELRNTYHANADGSVAAFKTPAAVNQAIGAGQIKRDYSHISVPVLAIFEVPTDAPTRAYTDRWVANLKRSVPAAVVTNVPGAGHYVFLTREARVLSEVKQIAIFWRGYERKSVIPGIDDFVAVPILALLTLASGVGIWRGARYGAGRGVKALAITAGIGIVVLAVLFVFWIIVYYASGGH
jgi:pimeloyl-ACP methyl ester carboxylesterase